MTQARGIAFLVVLHNWGGPDTPAVTARLAEFSAATGVPVVDSYSWWADRPIASFANTALHPNADGHAVLAEHIAQVLADGPLRGARAGAGGTAG